MYGTGIPPVGGLLAGGGLAATGFGLWSLIPIAVLFIGLGVLLIRHQRRSAWRHLNDRRPAHA